MYLLFPVMQERLDLARNKSICFVYLYSVSLDILFFLFNGILGASRVARSVRSCTGLARKQ